jgi:hypothetical protein
MANREPLTAEELAQSSRIDTDQASSLDSLVARIRQHLPGV